MCTPLLAATSEPVIEAADVLVDVETVRQELGAIRFVIGRPTNQQPEIAVHGAAPPEVYFQALTLYRKAERLCFEHTRTHGTMPVLPSGDIRPSDVYQVVDAALERIRASKKSRYSRHSRPARA
jgi:hypothetical protein